MLFYYWRQTGGRGAWLTVVFSVKKVMIVASVCVCEKQRVVKWNGIKDT